MLPELGHFALILALALALLNGLAPFLAKDSALLWQAYTRPLTVVTALLVALAFVCLVTAFVIHDFSVRYVAEHSNTLLPLPYRIAATWGGHEGSLLLWVLMLSFWALAAAFCSRSLPIWLVGRILAVLSLLMSGFLGFILLTSNPFARLWPTPAEGRDLNPMLQDPGLVLHPPMLYMGYVGFAVVFAFAIAALISGRFDAAWARWSRPWTLAAWVCLTIGIALGSGWAYYELGWGGWWFWDPVENASFMPWLVGAALLHSLAVSEQRGCFKHWTVLMAIAAFSFSLLGTFLVRSGVLTSVHAFANDPTRGLFILGFLVVVVGSSLALFAWRAPALQGGGRFSWLSRETAILLNNIVLMTATAAVLLGTLYPLLLDALDLGKISVGPPYFNAVFRPLMAPMVLLIGVAVVIRWKGDDLTSLARRLTAPLMVTVLLLVIVSMGISSAFGRSDIPLATYVWLGLALWVVVSVVFDVQRRARAPSRQGPLWRRWLVWPLGFWAMHVAHMGVAVFIFGVTLVTTFERETDVAVAVGDVVNVDQRGRWQIRIRGVDQVRGPNYSAERVSVDLLHQGAVVGQLYPEKRRYVSSAMPMTEAAIRVGLWRDIYVSIGEALPDRRWALRVYDKPLIDWIWGGCLLMALGGVLALFERSRRTVRSHAKAMAIEREAKPLTTALPGVSV